MEQTLRGGFRSSSENLLYYVGAINKRKRKVSGHMQALQYMYTSLLNFSTFSLPSGSGDVTSFPHDTTLALLRPKVP